MKKLGGSLVCGGISFACRLRNIVRLGIDFCSWSECKLAGHDDCFARFYTAFYHLEIALLPLSRLHRSQIDGIVRLHHENERSALTDLDGLRRPEPSVFEHVKNETHADKLGRPERAIRIWRDRARLHCSRPRLNRVVDEIQITGARSNFFF